MKCVEKKPVRTICKYLRIYIYMSRVRKSTANKMVPSRLLCQVPGVMLDMIVGKANRLAIEYPPPPPNSDTNFYRKPAPPPPQS